MSRFASETYSYVKQNGILRSFYNKNKNFYKENVSITAISAGSEDLKEEYALNFNSANYFFLKSFSFCFKKGTALITKYELETSSNGCRPAVWSFAGSNNNKNWKHVEEHSHNMTKNEIYSVDWNHGIFRCYMLFGITNQCSATGNIDIRQIEIFGTYFPNGVPFPCSIIINKCAQRINFFVMIVLLIY